MKSGLLFVFLVASVNSFAFDADATWKAKCMSCHTIGKGKLVGPDLKGVTKKRSEKWLLEYIEYPEGMIKEKKDKDAVALFNEYKTMMPEPGLTKDEIKQMLKYIEAQSK